MVAKKLTIQQVKADIDSHIDICAVRYESIEKEMRGVNARLKRLETILISSAGAIVLLLISLVLK
jgi:chaperonin cofactor prefoldin